MQKIKKNINCSLIDSFININALLIEMQPGGAVFGSIVGGSKIDERKHCALEVSKRNVSGVYG